MRNVFRSLRKRLFWKHDLAQAQFIIGRATSQLVDPRSAIGVPLAFRGHGHFSSIEFMQSPTEILGLLNLLCERDLRVILEIGTCKGGTLYLWLQLLKDIDGGTAISVDLPGGKFGGGYHPGYLKLFESFCQHGQRLICFRGNSQDPGIRLSVEKEVSGRCVDFLFIDGDHTYEGVRKDFESYGPLVRPGGLIAFHDICPRDAATGIEVSRFWDEVKTRYDHEVFISEGGHRRIGIGVLFV
jgi:cephalosporin hydroxylase